MYDYQPDLSLNVAGGERGLKKQLGINKPLSCYQALGQEYFIICGNELGKQPRLLA
jgi:hypothetical protein